ncbi:dihydrolipoyllysine-residue acetyltransferase [Pseudomonadales bacterium]|jgi:pyruvate dehydrogenase E2 component (dihydrolipoamide acetyltransferase)|nr:dihydrolipoyllysine-residue acetyltransferase [Pseudomonadales bacterium]
MTGVSKQTVKIPDLGGASDVEVIELCVTNGDTVSEGQSLIVVESDKASMEVPSPAAGKIVSIEISEGNTVSEGDIILYLEGDAAPAVPDAPSAPTSAPTSEEEPAAEEMSSAVSDDSPAVDAVVAPVAQAIEKIAVPDLGGADQVEVIEIMVSPGDTVAEGDGLIVMESDKASMEMPSPVAGVIEVLHIQSGTSLSEGDLVAEIKVTASAAAPESAKAVTAAVTAPVAAPTQSAEAPANETPPPPVPAQRPVSSGVVDAKTVYAGPAVRKLARELGVDLGRVKGSGPKSRIAKQDLHNYLKEVVKSSAASSGSAGGAAIPALPEVDFSQFGEIDVVPMSRLHKLTAANMHRSWLNVPHVTQYDDADITELEAFRKSLKPQMEKRNIKISPLPFLLKAVAAALQENPAFNVSLSNDGESIIQKKYIHIGMAVDTPAGLMVPVIKDVDKKGIWELSEEIMAMAEKARTRKLQASDMQGGCFTISSLGGIGGQGFTPIINTPEVGILGVSKLATKPVYKGDVLMPRKMLPLSLSYDHRAVNGGDAGRFLTYLVTLLDDVRQLVL